MKKTLTILLVAGMLLAALTGAVFATEDDSDTQSLPYYLSATGTIVSIEEIESEDSRIHVNIEETNGNPATLVVSDTTCYPFESKLKVGDVVTGYYLADAPMILIWPPQYTTAVLVAGMPENCNVNVDRFYAWEDSTEDYLLARGEQFAFQIGEKTEIVLANGDDFSNGEIEGRRLVVIYEVSTKSIPELATAIKVITLYEDVMPLPDNMSELPSDYIIDATGWPIMVDGVQIEAPKVFQTDLGFVMVPLRAIAEALGYEVTWYADTRSVTLNDTVKLTIGDPNYLVGETTIGAIEGAPIPVIVDNFTFVPLQFFRDVLKTPNAYAAEGVIEIHSEGETME